MKKALKIVLYVFLGFLVLGFIGTLLDNRNSNDTSKRFVNTQVLNVRKGPGGDFDKVGKVQKGDKIEIQKDSSGWVQFKYDTSLAWVKKSYTVKPKKWEDLKNKSKHEASKSTKKEPQSKFNAVSFEIQNKDDLSSKNYGSLNSKYDFSEVPKKHKIQYHISLGSKLKKKQQIRPTAQKIIQEIISKNPEIDEIILEFYSTSELAKGGGAGDIAQGIFAPNGELGNVAPEIARTNNKNNYVLKLDYRQDDLAKYLEQKRKNEKRFGLTESKRKEIYKALEKSYNKAIKEADKKYSIGSEKHSEAIKRLEKKYENQVMEKYSISQEVVHKIQNEALQENWAKPEF